MVLGVQREGSVGREVGIQKESKLGRGRRVSTTKMDRSSDAGLEE